MSQLYPPKFSSSWPLIGSQQGIWFADQLSHQRHELNVAHYVEIQGNIDVSLLSTAIEIGLSEADTLHSHYVEQDGQIVQIFTPHPHVEHVERIDLSHQTYPHEAALQWMMQDVQCELDITRPPSACDQPLYRHCLIQVGTEAQPVWYWYQRYHHIMVDGFSLTAITQRIEQIYHQLRRGEMPTETPFIPFSEVVIEQLAYQQSDKYIRDGAFWQQYCQTIHPPIDLRFRPENDEVSGVIHHSVKLSASLLQQDFGRCVDSEIAMATVFAYLHLMTGKSSITVGFPFMRRMGYKALQATGPVVNVLPLTLSVTPSMTLAEITQQLTQVLRTIRRHQQYDAEQLKRDLGRLNEPLYGPLLNFKRFDDALEFEGIAAQTHVLAAGPIDDIEFSPTLRGSGFSLALSANAQWYNPTQLTRHGDRFARLVEQLAAHPNCPLAVVDWIPSSERIAIESWSVGPEISIAAHHQTVLDLLAEQVVKFPNRPALVAGGETLTFIQLQEQVKALAAGLQTRGVKHGDIIGVALPRSASSVIALLGVMQAGAIYLPIDLDYPQDRVEGMLAQAKPRGVIAAAPDLYAASPQWSCPQWSIETLQVVPDEAAVDTVVLCRDDVAYVIFTSGSTGKPKGVLSRHGALLNLACSHQASIFNRTIKQLAHRNDVVVRAAHTTSFSFDASWEQILWMIQGHTLFVYSDDLRRDAFALVQQVQHDQIDALDLPPSLFNQMLDAGLMEQAHVPTIVMIGSEAVPATLWQRVKQYPALLVENFYGPTEYTVDAVSARVSADSMPVIGRPIANTRVYVLDAQLQPVPIGCIGELYIAGAGMAQGYLNQPAMTAERFIADPFVDGAIMYRTGDLVRWFENGQLGFIGRSDTQVKIRGYRIEIGDVEAALSALEEIDYAVVIAQPFADSHRLIAYCTLHHSLIQESGCSDECSNQRDAIRDSIRQGIFAALSQTVPDYMVPAALVLLDAFPLNVNGKIDHQALPAVDFFSAERRAGRMPETKTEQVICAVIRTLFSSDVVCAEDDFFALGGDSISAMALTTQLRQQGYPLTPKDIFTHKTIEEIARWLDAQSSLLGNNESTVVSALSTASPASIPDVLKISAAGYQQFESVYGAIDAILPTLPLQQGLLFQSQLDGYSNYNSTTMMTFVGEMDTGRLQMALDAILHRYPQLFSRFDDQILGEPVQVLVRLPHESLLVGEGLWPLEVLSLNALPVEQQAAALSEIEDRENQRQFAVMNPHEPLLYAVLVQHHQNHHTLILSEHHLVVDGWSTPMILRDLLQGYLLESSELQRLAERSTGSENYPQIINQLVARDKTRARQLWAEALKGAIPTLAYDRESELTNIQEVGFKLDQNMTRQMTALCRQFGVTLNTLMQGVWGMVLASMTGRDDVIFGTPISGRFSDIVGIDTQVGLFTNTIPVRIQLKPELSLLEQLQQCQSAQIQLIEQDVLGLGEIQQLAGGNNLFDTMLSVENYPDDDDWFETDYHGMQLTALKNRGYTHFPLTVFVVPGEQLEILVTYRSSQYCPQRLAGQIQQLLSQLIAQPKTPVCRYSLRTAEDQALITRMNRTRQPVPATTLRALMVEQARRTPNAIALRDSEQALTYRDVRQQVVALAAQLRAQQVSLGDIVAVALPRSTRLSLAFNSILEAGAIYLPLDVSYPPERLTYMVEDAKPKLIITDTANQAQFAAVAPVLLMDEACISSIGSVPGPQSLDEPSDNLSPADGAYLLYTSGSTGNPKGVLVSHQAIVNRLLWMQHEYQLTPADVVLQKTPCSFDVSVWEFFWPLIQGATLVMAPPASHQDPRMLRQLIDDYQVTTLHFVPSMLAAFVASLQEEPIQDGQLLPSLRQIFCSGEALSKALSITAAELIQVPLHNLYGPTEAAVDVTYCPAVGEALQESDGGNVPIGQPVWNTQLRILDSFLREVPIDVPGELYLGGDQLAMGYLNRSSLTAERFIADPNGNGERMYRTGDVVRWLASGRVEYLGRNDDQIKIRGQRIEIGEIEAVLHTFPCVKQAVVCAKLRQDPRAVSGLSEADLLGADQRQLVGYVVPSSPEMPVEPPMILEAMKARLPAHMVPAAIVVLAALPLSANGKLDRKALPLPHIEATRPGRPPSPGLETALAALFCTLLNLESVTAEDDFFALGGHSLLSMRLASDIRQQLNLPVTVGQVMTAPTVAGLALLLTHNVTDPLAGFDVAMTVRQGEGVPLICINPASGFAWQYTGLVKYLKGRFPIIGLQSPRQGGAIATAEDMSHACDLYMQALRQVQPQGPYHLIGYSFGGNVAHTLASRLEAAGEVVSFVALLDTYPTEIQDWEAPLDPQEAEQEKALFLNADNGGLPRRELAEEQASLLVDIDANYEDAVHLMMSARTQIYRGNMHLLVAEKTLPAFDIQATWQPYVGSLMMHSIPCRHQEMMSTDSLEIVGPLLARLLAPCRTLIQ